MNQEKTSRIEADGEFQSYYEEHLKPLEQKFESLRLKAVSETKWRFIAALATWLLAGWVIGYLDQIEDPFVIVFGLLAVPCLAFWAQLPYSAHYRRLKAEILPQIVSCFGDLRYEAEPDFDPLRYDNWMVLPDCNEIHSEDQIEGSYHGVPFKLAEVALTKVTETGSRQSTTRVSKLLFEGLMIIFELGREYPGVTLIRSRGSDMKGRFHLDRSLEEVGMGTGSGFEVFATTDAPGIRLVDGRFLERLAEVSARFEANHIFAGFHDNRLVMMIGHKGDYFEMSPGRKTSFTQDAGSIREQLERIFSIVDLLHLEGASVENRKPDRPRQPPIVTDATGTSEPPTYDRGGWGCLVFFVIFAAALCAGLGFLETELLLWWSAFGGLLMAFGLYLTIGAVFWRSLWAVVFGVPLLAGALIILYFNLPFETQELIRSRAPWL